MLNRLIETVLRTLWNGIWSRRPTRRTRTAKTLVPGPPASTGVTLGTIVQSPLAPPPEPGAPTEVTLDTEQKRRHVYMLGSTGSGKTNLLRQIVRADIEQHRGVCLVDARGELVDQILLILASLYAPEELDGRLLLIDLRETTYSVPVNPLRETAADPHTRVSFVLQLLKAMFEIGPQTEQVLRNSLLALTLASEAWSLYELELFLTVAAFRTRVLATVDAVEGAGIHRFFARFDQMPGQSSLVEPVLNKIAPWLSRPALRNMLAQRETVSFHRLLETRPDCIILVSLSADTLYADAHLVGSLLIHNIVSAAMRPDRRDKPGNEISLFLDEFENFDGLSDQFASILAEGRKFGLCACLSHQTSIQLHSRLRNLIRNIVGTQIFFGVGGGEAETLSGEIASDEPKAVLRNLLMNQKTGDCIVVRRGQPYARLRTRLAPDPSVSAEKAAAIRLRALQQFGRARVEIEAELAQRELELTAGPVPPQKEARRRAATTSTPVRPAEPEQILEVCDDEDVLPTVPKRARRKPHGSA